jgi:hypothetical protein
MTQTNSWGTASEPFTPAEIADLHRDDWYAAAAIIALMAGIFTIGLFGYLSVCLWIISS